MREEIGFVIEGHAKRMSIKFGNSCISLRGKAVQFILALITTDYPRYLTTDELHGLSDWRSMASTSVGKQAARIVDLLVQQGLPIIEWELKTSGWRLRHAVSSYLPEALIVEAREVLSGNGWSSMLRFSAVPADDVARWMQLCGSALIDMTEGQSAIGYQKLREASSITGDEGITAISDVLATRLGQKLPTPHLPVQKSSSASEFFAAAEARRIAAYARTSPSTEWDAQYALLERTLLRMIAAGDTTSQAILFNALSVLARRLGRMTNALECIREAAALAIFSGDLTLIQNVAFNFGNVLSEIARAEPKSYASDIYLGLIDLDIELRTRLRIGYDSAQAELLSAYLSFETGNIDGVKQRLSEAHEVILVSQQPHDIALYERVKGLLLCDTNMPEEPQFEEGIAALEEAVSIYIKIGNYVAADEVSRDMLSRQEKRPR